MPKPSSYFGVPAKRETALSLLSRRTDGPKTASVQIVPHIPDGRLETGNKKQSPKEKFSEPYIITIFKRFRFFSGS